MSKAKNLSPLKAVIYLVMFSQLISWLFLTSYFLDIEAMPTGTIGQYSLSYIEFNILLMLELGIILITTYLPLIYSSMLFAIPEVAKVLFGGNADRVIAMLKFGMTTRKDIRLLLSVLAIYLAFPCLYFISFLIIHYMASQSVGAFFTNLTFTVPDIWIVAFSLIFFKKNLRKPWLVWLNIFCLIFMIGAPLILGSSMLYGFCKAYSGATFFHSHNIFFVVLFLSVTIMSSFGLINVVPTEESLSSFRVIVAASYLAVVLTFFNLFDAMTFTNIKLLGQGNMPLAEFHFEFIHKQNNN